MSRLFGYAVLGGGSVVNFRQKVIIGLLLSTEAHMQIISSNIRSVAPLSFGSSHVTKIWGWGV